MYVGGKGGRGGQMCLGEGAGGLVVGGQVAGGGEGGDDCRSVVVDGGWRIDGGFKVEGFPP